MVSGSFSTEESANTLFHIPISKQGATALDVDQMNHLLKYTVHKIEECETSVESPEVRQSIKADLLQYLKASGAYE